MYSSIVLLLISTVVADIIKQVQSFTPSSSHNGPQPYRNILILDHLNFNHQKSQHDLLKAFYFDFLQCGIDPRKVENLNSGKKTLWANIGAQQFHLPEGKPDAQVLKGEIRLCFPHDDFQNLIQRFRNGDVPSVLNDSCFGLITQDDDESLSSSSSSDEIQITDPWGSKFRVVSSNKRKDERGVQDNYGDDSVGSCMDDLVIYTHSNANIAGIARFYEHVFDAPVLELCCDETVVGGGVCVVGVGPNQTLTFKSRDNGANDDYSEDGVNMHVDLRDEPESNPSNQEYYPSNYGPHISMYIRDIRGTYRRAENLGITYVNPRFNRKAYNEDEVVKDCMFRCLDIVDPENVEAGAILRFEHEVRSVIKADGRLYKSCPFDETPPGCII